MYEIEDRGSDVRFTESPASWNTRYYTPEGFQCQLTLRADSGEELLKKARSAMEALLIRECIPYGAAQQGRAGANGSSSVPDSIKNGPTWCPIHECEMRRWEKNGSIWYSHKVNGTWCKGR